MALGEEKCSSQSIWIGNGLTCLGASGMEKHGFRGRENVLVNGYGLRKGLRVYRVFWWLCKKFKFAHLHVDAFMITAPIF